MIRLRCSPRLPRAATPVAGSLLAAVALTSVAVAASAPVGADVSSSQCGKSLPPGQRFAIVGVNGGLANNANPCLAREVRWGKRLPGVPRIHQVPVSLYIDAADPGPAVADWPSPLRGTAGGVTPYGSCDGSWTTACAFRYGVQRASYSLALAAAASAPVTVAPWWLNAQKSHDWASARVSPVWAILNIATLQGFTTGLRGSGARGTVGFLSDHAQWGAITSQGARTSRLYFPLSQPDWVLGAGSLSGARARCARSFTGAPVLLAQFSQRGQHGDLACTRATPHRVGAPPPRPAAPPGRRPVRPGAELTG